jgi:methyl-accepting chemotaxis protein
MTSIKHRALAILLSVCLLCSLLPAAASADDGTLYLRTVDDLLAFSEQCALDTWSQGRTVVLAADLDLAGASFSPIPTFGGVFDGGGHTISGLILNVDGSVQGLFRYIQQSGTVKNLNVRGTIASDNSCDQLGGICGSNAGTILNCTFSGTVSGSSTIGGICGQNLGTVSACAVQGAVTGDQYAGGICGKNQGTITGCNSSADVNTVLRNNNLYTDELELDAAGVIDSLTLPDSEESISSAAFQDAGGICGLSTGILQSCTNTGTVGYAHLGYNVGGIVGRQSGYLYGCINNGDVYGRKDVGGIVGQMEPDITLQDSGHSLEDLQTELSSLHSQIDTLLRSSDDSSDAIRNQLEQVFDLTDQAQNSAHILLDDTSSFTDSNLTTLNSLDWISGTLDQMDPILDDAAAAARQTADALASLRDLVEDTDNADLSGATDQLRLAIRDLSDAADAAADAMEDFRQALAELSKAIRLADGGSSQAVQTALETLFGSAGTPGIAGRLAQAVQALADAQAAFAQAIAGLPQTLPDAVEALKAVGSAVDTFKDLLSETLNCCGTLLQNLTLDLSAIQRAAQLLSDCLSQLSDSGQSISDALGHLHRALEEGREELPSDWADNLIDAAGTLSHASSHLADSLEGLQSLCADLSVREPLEFVPLGDSFQEASEQLHSSLLALSGQMDDLLTQVDTAGQTASNQLQAISNQFYQVLSMAIDLLTDVSSDETDWSDFLSDQSEADISGTRLGKAERCANTGNVQADRNVGGIAGAMAIEYDLDPEEDTVISNPLGKLYETRSILEQCINRGDITAKKDCVGGCVGRMDLGVAIDCTSYATVQSTSGSYVGGIAGFSDASIRRCFSKCALNGERYLGGIAGSGSTISGCAAIARIDGGSAYIGAIAGSADPETVMNCGFLSPTPAGIDGVSYTGHAAPCTYEELAAMDGVPSELLHLTVTFRAGDSVVATRSVDYGQQLYAQEIPEIPTREGNYGAWDTDLDGPITTDLTVEAVYTPLLTILASSRTAPDSEQSLVLAEGSFTDEARLVVTDSTRTPPVPADDTFGVWSVRLEGAFPDGPVPLRLYCPGNAGTVWCFTDDQWVSLDATRNGQYLLVEMPGTEADFCIVPGTNFSLPLLVGAAVLLLALVSISLLLRRRSHRRAAVRK